jgi:hypothetical protein
MTRKFELRKATKRNVPLLIGLVGPSSSGKTYSAMRLASGIQKVVGGQVAVIDTEAGRAGHYIPEEFDFQHLRFAPPFGPLDYLEAFKHCVEAGAKVIVADSMTHEHSGEGGVLEQHAAEQQRLASAWKTSLEAVNFSAWDKPKAGRRKMVNYILQSGVHVIACYRAKQKLELKKEGNKTKPTKLGLMPEGDESAVYEMTLRCLLRHGSDGLPDWNPRAPGERLWVKCPGQFRDLFDRTPQLAEVHGEALARWAVGESLGSAKVELSDLYVKLQTSIEAADFVDELEALVDEMKGAKSQMSPREFGQLRKLWGGRKQELETADDDDFEEPTGT